MLIVCTLEFEIDPPHDWIVSFELRRIPPYTDARFGELDGVLESKVSSREENLIVAKSAQRQFCRNANVKQREMNALDGCLFCITQEHRNALQTPIIRFPGGRTILHFGG